jgi:hypothetical protein
MSWVKFGTSDISEWILEYNPETKEIKWRDHWVVEKLSKKKKQQIENQIINLIDYGKQNTAYRKGGENARTKKTR